MLMAIGQSSNYAADVDRARVIISFASRDGGGDSMANAMTTSSRMPSVIDVSDVDELKVQFPA